MTDTEIEPLELWISPGKASSQEIADVLIAMSDLYRAHGGKGLRFETTDEYVELKSGEIAIKHLAYWL